MINIKNFIDKKTGDTLTVDEILKKLNKMNKGWSTTPVYALLDVNEHRVDFLTPDLLEDWYYNDYKIKK